MEASSPVLLLKVMDCLALRMKAQAENIANAGTPRYRPVRVSFEDAVKAAAQFGDAAVTVVEPKLVLEAPRDGRGELRLDLELAAAARTAGRYGTMAEMLNRELQLEELAISGGRGG